MTQMPGGNDAAARITHRDLIGESEQEWARREKLARREKWAR